MLKSVISPTLERKIYSQFIRVHEQNLKTIPRYFVLMILSIILFTAAVINGTGIFFLKFTIYSPLTIFGVFIAIILIISPLLLLAVSCEIMNSMCKNLNQVLWSEDEVLKIVDSYKELCTITAPFIFLNFSLLVCNLIVNLYIFVLYVTGCSKSNDMVRKSHFIVFSFFLICINLGRDLDDCISCCQCLGYAKFHRLLKGY